MIKIVKRIEGFKNQMSPLDSFERFPLGFDI